MIGLDIFINRGIMIQLRKNRVNINQELNFVEEVEEHIILHERMDGWEILIGL